MARIRVQKLPEKKLSARQLLAEFCYLYPQYSYEAARRMPAKDVMLLLKTARRKQSEKYFYYMQIAAAPHTKKGSGVKKLSEKFKQDIKDNE